MNNKIIITGTQDDWQGEFTYNGTNYRIEPQYIGFHGKDLKLEILLHNYPDEDIRFNSPNSYEPNNYELTIGDIEKFIMDNKDSWINESIQIMTPESLKQSERGLEL